MHGLSYMVTRESVVNDQGVVAAHCRSGNDLLSALVTAVGQGSHGFRQAWWNLLRVHFLCRFHTSSIALDEVRRHLGTVAGLYVLDSHGNSRVEPYRLIEAKSGVRRI